MDEVTQEDAVDAANEAVDAMTASDDVSTETYTEIGGSDIEELRQFVDGSVNTIYLMGTSFIFGVLFTVFVLLVLDFIRRNAEDGDK